MQQVAADGAPYFWAGGRISGDKRNLSWENGRSQGISKGRHPWSFTGSRGAQPDGRGSEDCLAILNNFYNVSHIAWCQQLDIIVNTSYNAPQMDSLRSQYGGYVSLNNCTYCHNDDTLYCSSGVKKKRRTTEQDDIDRSKITFWNCQARGQGQLRINSSWLKTNKVLYKLNV